jgi:hypothetical protein
MPPTRVFESRGSTLVDGCFTDAQCLVLESYAVTGGQPCWNKHFKFNLTLWPAHFFFLASLASTLFTAEPALGRTESQLWQRRRFGDTKLVFECTSLCEEPSQTGEPLGKVPGRKHHVSQEHVWDLSLPLVGDLPLDMLHGSWPRCQR